MSDLEKIVENRLQEWRAWARKTELPRLGYKPSSVEATIVGSKTQSGTTYTYDDKSAEEIDVILTDLKRAFPKEEKAIVMYYYRCDDTVTAARKLSISLRTLNIRMTSGKRFLAGRLAHNVKGRNV